MSTKNLARTVIEGGRYGYNKWERRYSHAEVRAQERDYLNEVMIDLEAVDEKEIDPPRHVYKGSTDKLAPMYRWLEAQVGRLWTWQIDHIIPHSTFKYISMEENEFKECWALENLRPLASKQNLMESDRGNRLINKK